MSDRRWLILFCTSILPHNASARPDAWPGHWVNTTPNDTRFWILNADADGHVQMLMPAPQFQASYRMEAGGVFESRASDGSIMTGVFRGDTLLFAGRATHVRISDRNRQAPSGQGTWRSLDSSAMISYITFRSDSQVVIEVGFAVTTVQGDTLRLTLPENPGIDFTVSVLRDTLHSQIVGGEQSRYVRRPWGCVGIPAFDAPAPECR